MGHQNEETHNPPLSNWWIVSYWREGNHLCADQHPTKSSGLLNNWTAARLDIFLRRAKALGYPQAAKDPGIFHHFFNLQEPLKLLQKRCFHASGTTKKYNDTVFQLRNIP